MKIVGIIPGRMAASRFPGKLLALLGGHPVIEHVYRRAMRCPRLAEVYVATCDQAIAQAVEQFGGRAVMTSDRHVRCTDRVAEAAQGIDADIIVNIQGDEPLLHPDAITQVCDAMLAPPGVPCVNATNPITREEDFRHPNQIKVVCDRRNHALYMSRQPIPTTARWGERPVLRQLGLIAFRRAFLELFTRLSPTPLEQAESVDMLRAVESGHPVQVVVSPFESFGVDTPADLQAAEARLAGDALAGALFAAAAPITR